jgi:hypothetical protein
VVTIIGVPQARLSVTAFGTGKPGCFFAVQLEVTENIPL